MRGGFFRYFSQYIGQLPIHRIEFGNKRQKETHDRIVTLAGSMEKLHRRRADKWPAAQVQTIERQIAATDAEIDRHVYNLYGLTADEIAIVEEKVASR
jgi:hypothetical protein